MDERSDARHVRDLDVVIDVLCGAFASQLVAFAHLLDVAERAGLSPDLDQVEIVLPPTHARLSGFFDAATARRLMDAAGDDALVLILPAALIRGAFPTDERLRRIGRFDGRIRRVLAP